MVSLLLLLDAGTHLILLLNCVVPFHQDKFKKVTDCVQQGFGGNQKGGTKSCTTLDYMQQKLLGFESRIHEI